MSTLSISPFAASPLHDFRLPKSSSGRSNCGGDADWSTAFTSSNSFTNHEEQQQQHNNSHYNSHNNNNTAANSSHAEQLMNGMMHRSTSFPHLATSPSFFSPLDAQSSSPTLISPKLFSPLDSLSPPQQQQLFASSNRMFDLASPSRLSPSPLFAGTLSVSPRHGGHHSSLTASLSARQYPDPFNSNGEQSSSSSCPPPSYVPSAVPASTMSPVKREQQHDGDVSMSPAVPSAVSAHTLASAQPRPSSSSALSDMSNDHYLSFEVLNIDALTGHIKTEDTAFSPANAAVFDFVSLQQPLQDALTSTHGSAASASSSITSSSATDAAQQGDYAYPSLNFDDADAELLSRASSPISQLDTEDALDRITSPPDTSFFTSHAHNHNNHSHNQQYQHADTNQPTADSSNSSMPSPFTLPPPSTRHSRSSSSRSNKRHMSSHSQSQSTPNTPHYSSTSSHPQFQVHTDLSLLQSSVSSMDYASRVKFVESFKALADKSEPATACVSGDSNGMDPAVLNMIFSPADATVMGLEQAEADDEQADSDVDEDEMMDDDVPLHRAYTGERMTGRRRKRLHAPSSPTRRFSVPALRTTHRVSHAPGHPFPPLSPSLSVSSHTSCGSSPIPRSFASGSDEDSLHANSPHPRMAASVLPASVMAQQITPVQAVRVGVSTSPNSSNSSNITTATAVVEEVMNALPVSPSTVVTAEAVATASPLMSPSPSSTPTAAMAVAVPAGKARPSKVAVSSAVVVDGVVAATAVPASPVAATMASAAASPSPIHRARVLPGVAPRQAFALPHSKKLKTAKALAAREMYSAPMAACIPANAVSATVAYAQPMHAQPMAASAVEAKGWGKSIK